MMGKKKRNNIRFVHECSGCVIITHIILLIKGRRGRAMLFFSPSRPARVVTSRDPFTAAAVTYVVDATPRTDRFRSRCTAAASSRSHHLHSSPSCLSTDVTYATLYLRPSSCSPLRLQASATRNSRESLPSVLDDDADARGTHGRTCRRRTLRRIGAGERPSGSNALEL